MVWCGGVGWKRGGGGVTNSDAAVRKALGIFHDIFVWRAVLHKVCQPVSDRIQAFLGKLAPRDVCQPVRRSTRLLGGQSDTHKPAVRQALLGELAPCDVCQPVRGRSKKMSDTLICQWSFLSG